jgi:hypothetical protein
MGNRELWLFRQNGAHAQLMLKGGGYPYGPTSTAYHKGMLDFQTAWNMGGGEGGVEVYRFDGRRYKPDYCYSYTTDGHNNMKAGPHTGCKE